MIARKHVEYAQVEMVETVGMVETAAVENVVSQKSPKVVLSTVKLQRLEHGLGSSLFNQSGDRNRISVEAPF